MVVLPSGLTGAAVSIVVFVVPLLLLLVYYRGSVDFDTELVDGEVTLSASFFTVLLVEDLAEVDLLLEGGDSDVDDDVLDSSFLFTGALVVVLDAAASGALEELLVELVFVSSIGLTSLSEVALL